MSAETTWTAEERRGKWIITYNRTPGGKKNADGSTSYSLIFPALELSEFVSDQESVAAAIARELNAHPILLEALREAKVQVEILQERLGIKDTGAGTLSIINTALASVEPHTEGVGA